jgi:hypothetical protein
VYWKEDEREVMPFKIWTIYLNYDRKTGSLKDGRSVELIGERWFLK